MLAFPLRALWITGLLTMAFHIPGGLATGGETLAVVHPEKPLPVELRAAQELAAFLKKSTGMSAELFPETKAPASASFFVGRVRANEPFSADLPKEGYRVAAKNGVIHLVGDDSPENPLARATRAGTFYAVSDFLENNLDIAFLYPGDDGSDIPFHGEWKSPPDFLREGAPSSGIRQMMISYGRLEPQGVNEAIQLWQRRQKLAFTDPAWFGHSWLYYLERSGAGKEHPEWLALHEGERRMPHACTSNPEFRAHVANMTFDWGSNKNNVINSISPSDGYGFCECDNCRALDPPGTDYSVSIPNLSNRHWAYAAAVADAVKARDPSKGVGMFAYTAYSEAPDNVDVLPDNLYVSMTFSKAYFVKPELKKAFFDRIEKWSAKKVKIIGREYWGMHYWLSLPYIFTRQVAESMPRLADMGFVGFYGETQNNFATQGPNYYLVARLLWNPKADSAKELDRYYRGFGPASSHIRAYFDTFEDAILRNQALIGDGDGSSSGFAYLPLINSWPEVLDAESVRCAGERLAEARKAVEGAPEIYARRVDFIGVGYEYTKIMTELLALYRTLGRTGVPLTAFSLEGDIIEVEKYKMPLPKDKQAFWEKRPRIQLEPEEKIALLRRAVELGEQRAALLETAAPIFAVSRGMYQYTVENGIRPWHVTCIAELKRLTEPAEE